MSEPLALRWDDVSVDKGTALTRHADNKGKRDDQIPLHPIVVEHLCKIVDLDPLVFYWPHHRRTLWEDYHRIQEAAGIHLPCREKHEHTPACHVYGFHDLRRAFATVNAETLSADALQRLMRHKSYSTTQRYISMADQVNRAVDNLYVPEILRRR
ncbi:MAG: site-specific integrase [Candidatus Nealsonbacteria bacterium]|nr:site-specific integrase [Candidatus Nealsonbacteria bacterium]